MTCRLRCQWSPSSGPRHDGKMVTWHGNTRSHADPWGLLPGSGLTLADGTCGAQRGGA